MRNLQLSHDQIQMIVYALGIAEKVAVKQAAELRKSLVDVRGYSGQVTEQTAIFNLSTRFADLSEDIKNSKFDV